MTEKVITPLKVTIRCLPRNIALKQGSKCVITGKDATKVAIFARAY